MDMHAVPVPGAELEVAQWGAGEPVVFIQTALTADELLPVATDPALASYRKVLYHRRGYEGSSAVAGPGSVRRDAEDCAALLDALAPSARGRRLLLGSRRPAAGRGRTGCTPCR